MENSKTKSLAEKNAYHIKVINGEMGNMRDKQSRMSTKLNEIDKTVTKVSTDVDWLKRTYWIVASAAVGGLIASVLTLLFK